MKSAKHDCRHRPALNVDAGTNGGIRITGADRSNVLVRARVQTNAPTAEEAKNLATQVQVQATPGMIRTSGPEQIRDRELVQSALKFWCHGVPGWT